ncbi:kelch domain-containing protein 8B-like [Sinocyclocheilus rhinocerous]|uniref:kelch domain-containing protein 8B-like n=1 Tax=Sinocyclocheilus rhinocerous TaxID=307959 RepID=UPI0007B91C2F|nr:PREDICTED: kelch domain-containing protein 8B-like [Sinocyclocheilus rhinocerous]
MPIPEMALSPVKSLYWEVFPSMATQRVYCTPVLWAGRLYVLGGCCENGLALDSAEVLDLESQRWCELPPLPTARAGASAVVVGDQLMVMGGMDAQQRPLASVEVYHPDEGKWERKTGLGQPSMGITTLEKDGKVYALGGMGADTTPQASVRLYEPTKDQWLPLTSMPTPRYGAFSFLHGNKIYVLGGRQGKLPVTAFEAFDLEMKSWTRYPCIPSRRAFSSCAASDRAFFSLGGLQQPGPHNFYSRPHFVSTVEEFDCEQGGRQGKLPVTAFEAFDLEMKSWTRYPCIPSRRAFSSCAASDRAFFSLGGLQQPGPHNFYSRPHFVSTVEEFDCEQGVWLKATRSCRMREKRADFVAGYLGGWVIAAGGLGNQPSPLASVESYNQLKRRWEPVAPLPSPRCSCASIQTPNMLFLIGGVSQGPSNAVEALCLKETV